MHKSGTHRPQLDGLRAVAIALVVLHHATNNTFAGQFGVDLFFVLSGYLITSLMLAEHNQASRIDLHAFYVRRLARLYPALIVALIVLLPVGLAVTNDGLWHYIGFEALAGSYLTDIYMSLTHNYTGEWSQTWSLGIEMQFYLIWPIVFVWLLKRKANLSRVAIGLLGLACVSAIVSILVYRTGGPNFDPISRSQGILAGCALALVADRIRYEQALGWTGALGLALVVVLDSKFPGHFDRFSVPLATAACLMLLASLVDRQWVGAVLLRTRGAVWIGGISYAIYLWHFPLFLLLPEAGVKRAIAVPAAIVGTVLIAWASQRWVEAPARRWARRSEPKAPRVIVGEPIPEVSS